MGMAGSGALRVVMDDGNDAMPSRMMGLPSNHGTTLPAAPPSPSNDRSTFARPTSGGIMVPAAANITAPCRRMWSRLAAMLILGHHQTTQTYNPTTRVEEQATINRRVQVTWKRILESRIQLHLVRMWRRWRRSHSALPWKASSRGQS